MSTASRAALRAVLPALLVFACGREPSPAEETGRPLPPDVSACTGCDGPGQPSCAPERSQAGSCFTTLATYDGSTDLSISVAWSPIDDFVLSGADGELRLFELGAEPAFHELGVFREQGGRTDVAWSPDGLYALSASTDVRLLAIDRASGSITERGPPYTGHFGDVYVVRWSPDGVHALSAGFDGTVRLLSVDPIAGSLGDEGIFFVSGKIYDLSFSPDGSFAAVAAQDGTVRVFAVEAGALREVSSVVGDSWMTAVAWSPGGGELLAGTWLPCNTLELFSVGAGGQALLPVSVFSGHTSGLRALRFDPAFDLVVSAGHDDTLRLFDFVGFSRRLEHLATWSENNLGVHDVTFSPDGTRLIVAASHADRLTLVDPTPCFPE